MITLQIIFIVLFIITIILAKSTYVTKYYTKLNGYCKYEHIVLEEGKYKLTIIKVVLLLIATFIPVVNIVVYGAIYAINIPRYVVNIEKVDLSCTTTYVYSLRDNTLLSKCWNFLNTPV